MSERPANIFCYHLPARIFSFHSLCLRPSVSPAANIAMMTPSRLTLVSDLSEATSDGCTASEASRPLDSAEPPESEMGFTWGESSHYHPMPTAAVWLEQMHAGLMDPSVSCDRHNLVMLNASPHWLA